jgi:hypothetical protein
MVASGLRVLSKMMRFSKCYLIPYIQHDDRTFLVPCFMDVAGCSISSESYNDTSGPYGVRRSVKNPNCENHILWRPCILLRENTGVM